MCKTVSENTRKHQLNAKTFQRYLKVSETGMAFSLDSPNCNNPPPHSLSDLQMQTSEPKKSAAKVKM